MSTPGSPIKVLHIIKSLGRGGAEMLLPETLKLHNRELFEFHYMYFLPWKNQMVEAIERAGGRVTCMNASNNLQIILSKGSVQHYLKEHKINLIHCHLPWAGFLGRRLFKSGGIPVVYTEHNKQERYHWITRWINRMTFNAQSMAVAVSDDVADSIKRLVAPRIPVSVIRNGVNTESFVRDGEAGAAIRKEFKIPPDAVVVGIVAVFRTQKRLKDWLSVFETVAARHRNLYGIIVGDGPLKQELLDFRKERGLDSRVIMPGLRTDVVPLLSAMDIFMMTSEFEGLPVAMLEAMSAGCSVIATAAGGIVEAVRPGIDGLLVPVNMTPDLGPHLERLIEDGEERMQLAAAGRARVQSHFNLRTMIASLEQLYQRLA